MKRWLMVLAAGLLLAAVDLTDAVAGASQQGPREVVEATVNGIIEVLESRKDPSILTEADRERIRKVVAGRFDYRAMARRSLGRPWKQLSEAERTHFTELFRELLEHSYGNRLNEYHGQTVTFQDPEFKGERARVRSTVSDGNKETPVEYRLHQTPTGWQVYDIRIEGASLVRTFHQDFQSILQNGGYPHLRKTLEDKIARLKAEDSGAAARKG
ncbi:MAG: ABC transporter substrate-binding protein [Mariprofundaceae bacterium]